MNITEFQKSRFGLFIHWGIYSIPARGEWVRSNEEMKEEDYIPFANEFDPDLFDPHQWAKLAKKAGMKYAVMTAKHHDGYCMFDTKTTDWKANHDYVREFLDAFREEGLKVGLYYSLSYPSQAIPMFFCSPVLSSQAIPMFSCSSVFPKNMFFCLITMHIFLIPIKILNCFSLPFQISFILLYINILSLRKIENSIYTFYRNGTSTL